MAVKITIDNTKLEKVKNTLKKKYVVDIGILGTNGSTKEEGSNLTLAGVGFIQEKGSILNNIPARSFIKYPLMNHLGEEIKKHKKKLMDLIFIEKDFKKAHDVLGIIGENIIRDSFINKGDGSWSPNSPITINGGWMNNKKTGKPVYIKGKGVDNPLIDSGRLRQSITSKTRIK